MYSAFFFPKMMGLCHRQENNTRFAFLMMELVPFSFDVTRWIDETFIENDKICHLSLEKDEMCVINVLSKFQDNLLNIAVSRLKKMSNWTWNNYQQNFQESLNKNSKKKENKEKKEMRLRIVLLHQKQRRHHLLVGKFTFSPASPPEN